MNNIEKLAGTFDLLNEQGRQAYYADDTEYFLGQLEDFAKAYANSLQSSEPVAWRWGNDNAWLLTDEKPVSCDASVMVQPLFTHPPASVALEKTITAIEKAVMHGWLNRQELRAKIRQAVAEAEGK